jgi:hypothetical protein
MLGFLHSKKFLGLVILLVLLFVLIPLVLIFIVSPIKQKQALQSGTQKTQTTTFTANTELATFNGTPILVSNLNALALEQYGTNDAKSLTPSNLNILLNIYVERKILDNQNLGDVSVQIAQVEKTTGLTGNAAKYEALREKFTTTSAKSWNVYTIDFWLIPVNDLSQASAARQQLSSDVNKALDFAQTQMQKGTSVFNVATQISKNYPSLVNLIGVNTLRFDSSTNPSAWNTPAVYYYDKTNADDPFYKTLYAMTESSPVTKVLNNGNMGGSVIKMVKVNNLINTQGNYQDLLKSQESNLVITNDAIQKIRNTK